MQKINMNIDNGRLLSQITLFVGRQRDGVASLIQYLRELDQRKLHLALGYSGLFSFLTKKLLFSEASAWRYSQAVKVYGFLPEICDHIKSGKLNLTTIAQAAKELLENRKTVDQRSTLLRQLLGKSKAEINGLLAEKMKHLHKETVQTFIIPGDIESKANSLPSTHNNPSKSTNDSASWREQGSQKIADASESLDPSPSKTVVKKLTFTVSEEMYKNILRAKELLSSKHPKGVKLADVLNESLELFLEKNCPKRRAAKKNAAREKQSKQGLCSTANTSTKVSDTQNPTPKQVITKTTGKTGVKKSRPYLPVSLKEEILQLHDYQCSFVGSDNTRCQSRHNLHLDHITPFSLGGDSAISNMRVLCARHNKFEAERMLGTSFVENKINQNKEGMIC